jgi:hypothetical protein
MVSFQNGAAFSHSSLRISGSNERFVRSLGHNTFPPVTHPSFASMCGLDSLNRVVATSISFDDVTGGRKMAPAIRKVAVIRLDQLHSDFLF